jgi:hypothetical protein
MMNERIRDLAEQAGFEDGHQDRYGNSLSYELEKFAALIAQDCAELLDTSRQNTPPDHWGFVARIWTLQEAAKLISNHFGLSK